MLSENTNKVASVTCIIAGFFVIASGSAFFYKRDPLTGSRPRIISLLLQLLEVVAFVLVTVGLFVKRNWLLSQLRKYDGPEKRVYHFVRDNYTLAEQISAICLAVFAVALLIGICLQWFRPTYTIDNKYDAETQRAYAVEYV